MQKTHKSIILSGHGYFNNFPDNSNEIIYKKIGFDLKTRTYIVRVRYKKSLFIDMSTSTITPPKSM